MIVYIAIFVLGLATVYALSPKGIFAGKSEGLVGNELNHVQDLFFRTVFTLLGYVAKRDGPVNDKEVKRTETFMEKMDLSSQRKREAIRLFKTGADPAFTLHKTLDDLKGLAKKSPNLAQILLIYLINLARVDGALVNKEVEAVEEVAFGLGYSNITFTHLLKMITAQHAFVDGQAQATNSKKKPDSSQQHHQGADEKNSARHDGRNSTRDSQNPQQDDAESCAEKTRDFHNGKVNLKSAYDVLEVSPAASDAEVKKAYRLLVNQHHPDKLMGQGLPPYMVQAANECFKTIQAAYDYIQKARA